MENNLIPLSRGRNLDKSPLNYSIIDEDNFDKLIQYNWSINYQGYANRQIKVNGKAIGIRMHREIIPCRKDEMIDHINGNKLDNRRCNLRICNKMTNGQNSLKRKSKNGRPCSSVFKGVYKHCKKWQVEIRVNKNRIRLGRYDDELLAAYAYNVAARFYFGEFCLLNKL